MRYIQLNQPEKSAVTRSVDTAYHINFSGTSVLGMAAKYMDYVAKEAIEIWLHPDNLLR